MRVAQGDLHIEIGQASDIGCFTIGKHVIGINRTDTKYKIIENLYIGCIRLENASAYIYKKTRCSRMGITTTSWIRIRVSRRCFD